MMYHIDNKELLVITRIFINWADCNNFKLINFVYKTMLNIIEYIDEGRIN